MNSNQLQGYVHNYVQNAPEVNLSEMLNTLRNEGVNITRPSALRALRNEGLEPYTGVSLSGERARLWRKSAAKDEQNDEPEDETQGDAPQSKVESEITRVNASNEELLNEKQNLFDLVQKSVKLKKEIRAQQKQLLLEMSQLVQAMYGDADAEP